MLLSKFLSATKKMKTSIIVVFGVFFALFRVKTKKNLLN